jgi:hypothetical protein
LAARLRARFQHGLRVDAPVYLSILIEIPPASG